MIIELKRKYELVEHETIHQRNKYSKQMFHKTEIENLLNKIQTDKNVSNIDKDLFREIKND